jgi:hypothetical protein
MDESAAKLGLTSARIAFAAAVIYTVVQLMQLVRLVTFPWDAILIYGSSLCIAPAFVLAFVALHYVVPPERRVFTHAALVFAAMYAAFVSLNYVVQLGTVIPAALRGELESVRLLDQTPHSLFWDVDALGYICMAFATLLGARAFTRDRSGVHRWARRLFLANAAVTPLIAIVYFYPHFSETLLLLGLPWAITAPGAMLMLALFFARELRDRSGDHLNGPRTFEPEGSFAERSFAP